MRDRIIYLLDYGLDQKLIFKLGWELRRSKYILIPVSSNDLMELFGKYQTRYPVVSFVLNRQHLEGDLSFKRRYLFNALKNFKVEYLEFTSFKDAVEKYLFTRKNKIQQIGLPVNLDEASKIICEKFRPYFEEDKNWPGGRRGSHKELGEQ